MAQRKLMSGEVPGVTKFCGSCKEVKSVMEFGLRNRAGQTACYQSTCKLCASKRLREWNDNNPIRSAELKRDSTLRKYGLTRTQYDAMMSEQGGGCAVCGSTDTQRNRVEGLLVDHDHESGRVRGLLCHPCNVVLGFVRDDPERLRSLLSYLEG